MADDLRHVAAATLHNRMFNAARKGRYDSVIIYSSVLIERNAFVEVAYLHRIIARSYRGNYEGALADMEHFIQNPQTNLRTLATVYTNRGHCQRQVGHYNASIADCSHAIEIAAKTKPEYGFALALATMNRGLTYSAMKDHEMALKDAEEALELAGQLPPEIQSFACADYGAVLGAMDDMGTAKQQFEQALEIAGKQVYPRAWAFCRRAFVYLAQGNYAEAIRDFSAAIEIAPQLGEPYHGRALAYTKSGQSDLAKMDYQTEEELARDPVGELSAEELAQLKNTRNIGLIVSLLVVIIVLLAVFLMLANRR